MAAQRFAPTALAVMSLLMSVGAVSCTSDDVDEVSRDWMHGTISGSAWTAGPATVRVEPERGVVIRIFEAGTDGLPCDIPRTTGRRIEVVMARLMTGHFEAATDEGCTVQAWDGETGKVDRYSIIEIDDAPREQGKIVFGRARYSSTVSKDEVQGEFQAEVCETIP